MKESLSQVIRCAEILRNHPFPGRAPASGVATGATLPSVS
jgi:hypothetical protein